MRNRRARAATHRDEDFRGRGWLARFIILALASRAVFAHGSERRPAFATDGARAELAAQLRVHTFSGRRRKRRQPRERYER